MKKSKEAKDLHVGYKDGIDLSKDRWEMKVPATAEGFGDDPKGAWLPRPGKDRAQPHEKINECDH